MALALPDKHIMYQAVLNRDSSYDGLFYIAVKTTGIFCRPTCRARKPKKENVEFFHSAKEALACGYRPCKLCRPMELSGETPEWIRDLLLDVQKNPVIRISDNNLRKRGIEPNRLRRWFKKNHEMTFQAYLRSLRISQAFSQIKHGDKVIDSAFSTGYESLSGFTDTFKKICGFSPSESSNKTIVKITRILTPLGPMMAGAVDKGICLLEFADRRMLETQIRRLTELLAAQFIPGEHLLFNELEKQLREYFSGERREFTLPLVMPGTIFQKRVWNILKSIPYGETRSYKDQSLALDNPAAVRAVARANGQNRLAVIIPCHRVIGSNGELTGYGGGLWRKKYLLDLESGHVQ